MNMLCHNCLRSPAECLGSCKQESPQFLAAAESVRKKIADNTDLLLMFQHAYDQVDSSKSSGIGSAMAQAFLTDAEGQDGPDERDTNDTNEGTEGHSEGSTLDREPADVSLDTDTAITLKELDDPYR